MVKTQRCDWCGVDPLYVAYHDEEWGVPISNDGELFELLNLEGMQAGLSWLTVLRKRARMREQFFGFDARRLAEQGEAALPAWLNDPGLIRHRGKLEAVIGNARACLDMDRSLAEFVWSFVGGKPTQNHRRSLTEIPSATDESVAMSKALKRAGFRFVGPTTCYAFMQSAGLVNDHLVGCHRREVCADLGSAWSV